ncbi:MAG TPA: ABC transporter family substrate-binding protein, partial [Streptomyces sp.]
YCTCFGATSWGPTRSWNKSATDKETADEKSAKAADKKADKKKPAAGEDTTDNKASRAEGQSAATRVLATGPSAAVQSAALKRQAGALQKPGPDDGAAAGAYAPVGTAAPASVKGLVGKNGKALTLRFVLPSGPGSRSLRAVGDKIAGMLESVGIGTEITKVPDESYFKDHIASGDYDLALYSWPATAYPATDGRPIYAKPEPATDGSLLVEQNYTRVGTDHIDQLFDQAVSELDQNRARNLMKQADARIWAAAGSIPLYQRPQLVAVDKKLANVGAFGFATPRYQDIGYKKHEAAGPPANRKK